MFLEVLKLSISDIIATQKGSNGDGKLHFFGQDYILLALFAQKKPYLGKDTFWVDPLNQGVWPDIKRACD